MGYMVDQDQLALLGDELGQIRDEFDGLVDHIDEYEADMGHDGAKGALSSFSTNWKNNRGKIVEKLAQASEMAIAAAESYTEGDDEIASSLADAGT